MYKILKSARWAIVLLIRFFVFPCPRCRRRRTCEEEAWSSLHDHQSESKKRVIVIEQNRKGWFSDQKSTLTAGDLKKTDWNLINPIVMMISYTRRSAAVRINNFHTVALSLPRGTRLLIITPKGLWVLIRCFLRSFHCYSKIHWLHAHNFFFLAHREKNPFSPHFT